MRDQEIHDKIKDRSTRAMKKSSKLQRNQISITEEKRIERGCEANGDPDEALEFFPRWNGSHVDLSLGNALLKLYAKTSSVKTAARFILKMPKKMWFLGAP
ncbi:hypothetical protein ACFX13_041873 [Malus domestica]